MHKRLIKTVSLRFFEDDATGEWGLTHSDTIDGSGDDSFNAFWDGRGIFHDVFEHSHEHTKYFQGIYAMNIGGEMAAMGALCYYYNRLGVYDRLRPGYHSPSDNILRTTFDMIQEAVEDTNFRFGSSLESNVPRQKETDDGELECIVEKFAEKVTALVPNKSDHERFENGELFKQNRENEITDECKAYKASVTPRKVADLHRWGFRMAQKLVPNTSENQQTMNDFLETWKEICKLNPAQEMALQYRGIEYKLYRTGETLSWTAIFMPHVGDAETERITIRSENIPAYLNFGY
jgi:hypothetical protein